MSVSVNAGRMNLVTERKPSGKRKVYTRDLSVILLNVLLVSTNPPADGTEVRAMRIFGYVGKALHKGEEPFPLENSACEFHLSL